METVRINTQDLAEAMVFVNTEPCTKHGINIITILLDGGMLHDAIARRIRKIAARRCAAGD